MAFHDLWQRWRKGGVGETPFAQWPPVPDVKPIAIGKLGQLTAWPSIAQRSTNSRKYKPAIVIGLGDSGEFALRAWLNKMAHDPAGAQDHLRAMLLTRAAKPKLLDNSVRSRGFDLLTHSAYTLDSTLGQVAATRQDIYELFRNPHTFEPVWQFLSRAVEDLRPIANQESGIRLILSASAAEAEIGLLGDLLHILSRLGRQEFASVTLLLTLESSTPALDDAEMFAVLREIGRLTFGGGWHWMPPFPIGREQDGAIQGSLLDAVFLVEAKNMGAGIDLNAGSPPHMIGEVLAETIFCLLHPSAKAIWENLLPTLIMTGTAREQTKLPFFHSLGIATLYVPIEEIKRYAALRLTHASLFGEQSVPEGLLAQATGPANQTSVAGVICRQWLAPYHPFWEWLLGVTDVSQLRKLPALGDHQPYLNFFRFAIANGLYELLNDLHQTNSLERAHAELNWLKQRFQQILALSQTAADLKPSDDHERLHYIVDNYVQIVVWLLEQIDSWQRVLYGSMSSALDNKDTLQKQDGLGVVTDWRAALGVEVNHPKNSVIENETQTFTNALTFLQDKREAVEVRLTTIANNEIYRPLTADSATGLSEIETYYKDSIRPELSRYGVNEQPRYERVRERIGWWIDVSPNQFPRIYLACLAADQQITERNLPKNVLFLPAEAAQFVESVFSLAQYQVNDVGQSLTGVWMAMRLREAHFRSFLERASRPFLSYDPRLAANLYSGAAAARRYMIGVNQEVTSIHATAAFPNIGLDSIDQINGGEPSRLTAVGFRLNIPLSSITRVDQAYEQYGHREEHHLYPQEKIATRYENMLRRIRREIYVLPSELCMAFADERLVTLFCQAVFCQVIQERHLTVASDDRYWALPSLLTSNPDEDEWTPMHPTRIADYPNQEWRSLFEAMRWFTVEATLENTFGLKLSHPLHSHGREIYWQRLYEETQRRSQSQLLREFEKQYLVKWQIQVTDNPLGRAFLDLLLVEMKRTLPSKW